VEVTTETVVDHRLGVGHVYSAHTHETLVNEVGAQLVAEVMEMNSGAGGTLS
jgi:hypothetical protein